MSTKNCPSCGADVPSAVQRCKHCFHDFTEVPAKKSGPIVLLGAITLTLVLALGIVGYMFTTMAAEKTVVDEETTSIIVTRKSVTGDVKSERYTFDSISRVEYVTGGDKSLYEVVAVTNDNKRVYVQRSSDQPLGPEAAHIATVLNKPLVTVNNVQGVDAADKINAEAAGKK